MPPKYQVKVDGLARVEQGTFTSWNFPVSDSGLGLYSVSGHAYAMNSKVNQQVLVALQHVVGATLKNWLNEYEAAVLQELRAVAEARTPP